MIKMGTFTSAVYIEYNLNILFFLSQIEVAIPKNNITSPDDYQKVLKPIIIISCSRIL